MNNASKRNIVQKIAEALSIPVDFSKIKSSDLIESIHDLTINDNEVEIMFETQGISDKKNAWIQIYNSDLKFMARQEDSFYFKEFKVPFTHQDIIINPQVEYLAVKNGITTLRFGLRNISERI